MPDAAFVMTGRRPQGELRAGTPVDVRSRYVGDWSRGFEVAEEVAERGYRVRRVWDGTVLPDVFDAQDVRPHKRRQDLWWY